MPKEKETILKHTKDLKTQQAAKEVIATPQPDLPALPKSVSKNVSYGINDDMPNNLEPLEQVANASPLQPEPDKQQQPEMQAPQPTSQLAWACKPTSRYLELQQQTDIGAVVSK